MVPSPRGPDAISTRRAGGPIGMTHRMCMRPPPRGTYSVHQLGRSCSPPRPPRARDCGVRAPTAGRRASEPGRGMGRRPQPATDDSGRPRRGDGAGGRRSVLARPPLRQDRRGLGQRPLRAGHAAAGSRRGRHPGCRRHALALRTDGTVVGWGSDSAGAATPPCAPSARPSSGRSPVAVTLPTRASDKRPT
ncbi:RCC1-like domain-containing protein [Rubrivirga sp. IMCC45206]|uniref:RCC1-like domain-containing protein n=1 Tax=Rubrivirga sp. IMCC45206 TaxID=3391614 RepID=UPI00398FE568